MGVFDTPTLIIDKERFVGIDKIALVSAKLAKMGLAKKA